MTKYSEALNIETQNHNDDRDLLEIEFFEKYGITCINVIKEMKEKAEKYDLEHCNGTQNIIEHLIEHNNKLKEENKTLKDGIKAITKHYDISFNPFQIAFNQIYFGGIPREDTDKIKAMLEVVENA